VSRDVTAASSSYGNSRPITAASCATPSPAEAVEARHERVLQGRRDREPRQRIGTLELAVVLDEQVGLDDRLRELLDE